MKKSLTLFTVFILLVLSISLNLISCENFLNGSLIQEQVESAIEYANATEFTIRISPKKPEMGTVVSGGEQKVKVKDKIKISFECSSDYLFDKWVVIDKNTEEELNEYVAIPNPKNAETEIEILKQHDNILIRPLCNTKLILQSKTPSLAQNTVSRDSAIVVTFNTPIDSSSFYFSNEELNKITEENGSIEKLLTEDGKCYAYKYSWDSAGETITYKNINITSQNQNFLKYFGAPELIDTVLTIKTNQNTFIPLEEATRTLNVELSGNIINSESVTLGTAEAWQYKVDSSTTVKTQVTMEMDSRIPTYETLEGDGSYSVGDSFTIKTVFSSTSNYEFANWSYDDSKVTVVNPKAATSRAVITGYSTTPIVIKAMGKLKPEYDTVKPVINSYTVEKRHYSDRDNPLRYSEVNNKTPDQWESDEECQQNFPTEKTIRFKVSAYDTGAGLKSIKLKEQKVNSRDGAISIGREYFTTYTEDKITKTYDENGYEVWNLSSGDYILQSEGEGAVELTVYAVDLNNNEAAQEVTVIKVDNWFTQDQFIITNEPEIWCQDELTVTKEYENDTADVTINGKKYPKKEDNRTKPFDNDWYNNEIKTFRWAFRLYKDFNISTDDYYTIFYYGESDPNFWAGAQRPPVKITEADCYNLKYKYTISDNGIFENGGVINVLGSRHNGSNQGKFKVYVPKPGNIKAITTKKFPVTHGGTQPYPKQTTRGFFYKDTYNATAGYCNTKTFMVGELTQAMEVADTDKSTYYPNVHSSISYSGIENGMYHFYYDYNEANKYKFSIDEDCFKAKTADFLTFNYYGEQYRDYFFYTSFQGSTYGGTTSTPDPENLKYFRPTHRILGKTGNLYNYNESTVEDYDNESATHTITNNEALTITNWNYTSSSGSSSLSTVTFDIANSHTKAADEEEIIFIVIKSGTTEVYGIATLDEKTNKYVAKIHDFVMTSNYVKFYPYRIIVKNGKSSVFQGTISNQSDNSKGSAEYGKNTLFGRSRVAQGFPGDDGVSKQVFNFYGMSINNHGKEICAVASILPKEISYNSGSYYNPVNYNNAEYCIVEKNEYTNNSKSWEIRYKNGEYKPAILDTKGPVMPKDNYYGNKLNTNENPDNPSGFKCSFVGIPLEDLVDGSYYCMWAIKDEYGNFSYQCSDTIYTLHLYAIDDAPVYDFSSKENLKIRLVNPDNHGYYTDGLSVFYKMADDGWNFVWAQKLTENADNNATALYALATDEQKLKNAGWVKYYTAKKIPSYEYKDGYSPSAWTYDYFGTASAAEPSVIEHSDGLLVSGDTPVLCYVVASSRNRDQTGEDWELRPRYVSPKVVNLSSSQNLNIYSYNKDDIPEGWYYKIYVRYAKKNTSTGKTEIKLWKSELKQK